MNKKTISIIIISIIIFSVGTLVIKNVKDTSDTQIFNESEEIIRENNVNDNITNKENSLIIDNDVIIQRIEGQKNKCDSITKNNISYCQNEVKCESIYYLIKSISENKSYCENIKDDILTHLCEANIKLDDEYCNKIIDVEVKEFCVISVDVNKNDDITKCNKLPDFESFLREDNSIQESFKKECEKGYYLYKALKTKNSDLCLKINDLSGTKNECIGAISPNLINCN